MSQVALFGESTVLPNLEQLAEVKQQAMACSACRLADTRTKVVFSDGNPQAQLMLIGEGPGQNEDETGVPFVGRAGQLLTKIIESAGFDRQQDTYICNVVKCRPPQNRAPFQDEADACKGFLQSQINLIQPAIILLVGKTALTHVLGEQKIAISKMRGQWLENNFIHQPKMMTIFHPSYLLRNPSQAPNSPKWLTWQDMLEVRRVFDELGFLANGKLPEKMTS